MRSCPRLLMESHIVSPTSIVARTPHRCQPDDSHESLNSRMTLKIMVNKVKEDPLNCKREGGREEGKKPPHHSVILGNVHSGLMLETAMNTGSQC